MHAELAGRCSCASDHSGRHCSSSKSSCFCAGPCGLAPTPQGAASGPLGQAHWGAPWASLGQWS
eukprot:5291762-Alexandrium_andersonii.AAC.1